MALVKLRYLTFCGLVALLGTTGCDDKYADPDFDGLVDTDEERHGTDKGHPDTDRDGWSDGFEVWTLHTNPLLPDTDGDGISDYVEEIKGTNPRVADSDGDNLADGDVAASFWVSQVFGAKLPNLFKILPGPGTPTSPGGTGNTNNGPAPANDSDRDGVLNDVDNCPATSNASQVNIDNDAYGDACDTNSHGPIVALSATHQGHEGVALSLSAVISDLDATANEIKWTYESSASIHCQFADDTARVTTMICDDDGLIIVRATVRDGEHTESTAVTHVTLLNRAPSGTWLRPTTAPEGVAFTLEMTLPVDVAGDLAGGFTYAFDCGLGYTGFTSIAMATCIPPDSGALTVRVAIQDEDGDANEYSHTMTITNIAPAALVMSTGTIFEGSPHTIEAWGIDWSSLDTASLHYAFACDGEDLSTVTYALNSSADPTTICTFPVYGLYTVRVKVIDKDGGSVIASRVVSVENVAPTIDSIGSMYTTIDETFATTLSFTDPGLDDWTVTVDYGDGSPAEHQNVSITSFGLSHTYTTLGTFMIQLSVSDGVDTDVAQISITVRPLLTRMKNTLTSSNFAVCATRSDGKLKCWGDNSWGQLGFEHSNSVLDVASVPPIDLGDGVRVEAVETNGYNTCALLDNETLKCWGLNGGQLGLGDSDIRGAEPGTMGDDLPPVDLGTGRVATRFAVGGGHICAVLDDGSVKCWGMNGVGQLGVGDNIDRLGNTPSDPNNLNTVDLGLGRTALRVVAGSAHSCALLENGDVKCWGDNEFGQLGLADGSTTVGDTPGSMGDALAELDLGTHRKATELFASASGNVTCAILDNGDVKCWGDNTHGGLGQGHADQHGGLQDTMGDFLPPINLGTNRTATVLATGHSKTCAILDSHDLKCWGRNDDLTLGIEYSAESTQHWGDDPNEMGDFLPPVDLGSSHAVEVALGDAHGCARLADHRVVCWGLNWNNVLGNYNYAPRVPPDMGQSLYDVPIEPATGTLVAASHSSCVLVANVIKCWGQNASGQLGVGDTLDRGRDYFDMGDALLPAAVLPAQKVAQGNGFTCALHVEDGTVQCWGDNARGQLGLGHTDTLGDALSELGSNLISLDLGSGAHPLQLAISPSGSHVCARLASGEIKCWGDNTFGQLGQPNVAAALAIGDEPGEMGDDLPSVPLGLGRTAVSVSAGDRFSCALLDNGLIKCWGDNANGSLGVGDTEGRDTLAEMGDSLPYVDLGPSRTAVILSSGGGHSCAVLDNGLMKCWGENGDGQLGIGDNVDRGVAVPQMGADLPAVDLGSDSAILKISVGGAHTCALLDGGSIKCWGRALTLGLGDANNRGDASLEMGSALPNVNLSDSALLVAAGATHTCAWLGNGTIKCWGDNTAGALGTGDTMSRGQTVASMGQNLPIVRLQSQGIALTANATSVCGKQTGQFLKCWGNGEDYQLGPEYVIGDVNMGDDFQYTGQDTPFLKPCAIPNEFDPAPFIRTIGMGRQHACLLREDGTVSCWGENNVHQQGWASGQRHGSVPTFFISGGNYSVNIDLTPVVQLAVGGRHNCARFNDGRVKCWGENNGKLGIGTADPMDDSLGYVNHTTPGTMVLSSPSVDLGVGRIARSVAAGENHSCAVLDNNSIKCWGLNDVGQLGIGSLEAVVGDDPSELGDLLPTVDLGTSGPIRRLVTGGGDHSCAILENYELKCWGRNDFGQLGLGDEINRGSTSSDMGVNLPQIDLGAGRTAREVAVGARNTCVILDNRLIKCWGSNSDGQLGLADSVPPASSPPASSIDLGAGILVEAIAVGDNFVCASFGFNGTKCWGGNENGQLNRGNTDPYGSLPGQMGNDLVSIDTWLSSDALQSVDEFELYQLTCPPPPH